MDGLALLSEARAAGLSVRTEGDRLVIRGPKEAAPVARLLLERKPAVLAALSAELPRVSKPYAWRIYSRLLDAELWIVETETDAGTLEAELAREGDRRPVLTAPELCRLAEMAKADAVDAARKLLDVKRVFPGSRLCHVGAEGGYDA